MAETNTIAPSFGITFKIGDSVIPITAVNPADIASKGLSFTLPNKVELGTMKDLTDWISANIDSDFSATMTTVEDLPIIGTAVKDLENATWTVDTFSVDLPPSGSSNATTLSILVDAEFAAANTPKLGPISIQGFSIGADYNSKGLPDGGNGNS